MIRSGRSLLLTVVFALGANAQQTTLTTAPFTENYKVNVCAGHFRLAINPS